mmetsp:Transcript_3966/g.5500  ORF Transcript_3966/g.5500 Transcript_3966/m.5500 type:complete len:301 (-) Transcript_3966:48-950(-)
MSGERGLQCIADSTYRSWEGSSGTEFPTLCEFCMGDSPYTRMLKDRLGGKCKMCDRPFTVYRWKPGRGEGYKRTEVCQTCSKTRNICQSCILDLEFGLPSQLRDAVLSREDDQVNFVPSESDVNREYQLQQRIALINSGENLQSDISDRVISIARNNITNRAKPRVSLPEPVAVPSYLGKRGFDYLETQQQVMPSTGLSVVGFDPLQPEIVINNTLRTSFNSISTKTTKTSTDPATHAPNQEVHTDTPVESTEAEKKEISKNDAQMDKSGQGSALKKKAVAKFVPRPPAGPPPPSAFADE